MNYKTQIPQADGSLPPEKWTTTEAPNMRAAAIAHLEVIGTAEGDYPLKVFVSDGKLLHPNGAPVCAHEYRFELVN